MLVGLLLLAAPAAEQPARRATTGRHEEAKAGPVEEKESCRVGGVREEEKSEERSEEESESR